MSGLSEKLFERAVQYTKAKDWSGALRLLTDAVKFDPDMYEAWILRGNILVAEERYLDAVLNYERALTINNNLYDAWNNMGTALANLGMFPLAYSAFQRSLQSKINWQAHAGLGYMYCTTMDLAKAEEEFRKALEIDTLAEHHYHLGCVLLGQGKWDEGFPEFQYRWIDTPYTPLARRSLPQWKGESLKNKTVVLYPEQGYGDEIMGFRFAKYLLNPRKIYLLARTPLLEIAKTLGPHIEVLPAHAQLPDADFSCATLDLPMALGLQWNQVQEGNYLKVNPERVEKWRSLLPKEGLNVGICWMSGGHFSTTLSIQRTKSLYASQLRALKIPGINLISLQKPVMEKVPEDLKLIDFMSQVDDFADTAALISCLNLTISVDTAVAHIAGAIGAPVWNLVRFSGYWPWLAPDLMPNEQHSIWYPTMRLYRQSRGADWEEPLQRIAKDLASLT